MNRIGENIVVFDFIREDVAEEILEAQENRIIANLRADKNLEVRIEDKAKRVLREHAIANLENGGRGIGNIVESLLINPLSRYLFDNELFENRTICIEDIKVDSMPYSLVCSESGV